MAMVCVSLGTICKEPFLDSILQGAGWVLEEGLALEKSVSVAQGRAQCLALTSRNSADTGVNGIAGGLG